VAEGLNEKPKLLTLSAAAFVLFCFFLPWIQVSCLGLKDSASGLDLARGGRPALWLIPALMVWIIILGITIARRKRNSIFALASALAGAVSAYLMNRERIHAEQELGLVGANVTGWFWLGLAASVGMAAAAVTLYINRLKSE
jgi:hypothetical protein